jgi:hypothetical protein
MSDIYFIEVKPSRCIIANRNAGGWSVARVSQDQNALRPEDPIATHRLIREGDKYSAGAVVTKRLPQDRKAGQYAGIS